MTTRSAAPTMRAHVCRRYGGPEMIEPAIVPRPVPKDGEVLVRILATTVSAGDWRVRTLCMPRGFGLFARPALGFVRPRNAILGTEFAGLVESVGAGVRGWREGEAVMGIAGVAMGCHAQYRAIAADGAIARKPASLDFGEAASLGFGGSTALHFLRKAALRPGERMLVIGASGSVGSALVQLGRHLGAEVVGVTSAANAALVRALGASHIIDYARAEILADPAAYDVIADTVGATGFGQSRAALRPGGRLLAIAGGLADLAASLMPARGGRRVIAGPAPERGSDVAELADLAARGILRPVIDNRFAFDDIRAAHARVETRRKRGAVVVDVPHEDGDAHEDDAHEDDGAAAPAMRGQGVPPILQTHPVIPSEARDLGRCLDPSRCSG